MPMDQQQQLMAQQMVPQQMVQHQMVAQPGSVNGMSPHPSMVANQNHIQEKWMEIGRNVFHFLVTFWSPSAIFLLFFSIFQGSSETSQPNYGRKTVIPTIFP